MKLLSLQLLLKLTMHCVNLDIAIGKKDSSVTVQQLDLNEVRVFTYLFDLLNSAGGNDSTIDLYNYAQHLIVNKGTIIIWKTQGVSQ